MPATFALGGDLEVRRLGFGGMRLCGPRIMGWPEDRENALAVLRRALDLGVNLIDTSDAYGPEINELQVAEALHPYPEGLVIATKGGLVRNEGGDWIRDGRPEHLREACEASLRRLRIDRIDLYQLHAVDGRVPIEESVGELARLREEGTIRHVGLSNVEIEELERAREVVPVVSVQNRYNLADRHSEDVLEACERDGLAFLPWFPLAVGDLAQQGGRLDEVARRREATPAQVALAWLLRRSSVVLPIPGTASLEHLEENVAAARVELSDEDFAELVTGLSPIMQALYEGDRARAEALRHPELDVFEAAALGDVERLRALLEADPALVSSWSVDGFTPLHYAVFFGDPDTVRFLAEGGADLEAPARNKEIAGQALPLHSAVAAGRPETVEALLAAGADPRAQRPGGGTALEEAELTGRTELADLLRSASRS